MVKQFLTLHVLRCNNSIIDQAIEFAECTTGEVRLTDISDNSGEDSRQGTIQICVNNAWGSVCSDHFFDNTDAAVFCSQLPGFKGSGMRMNTLKRYIQQRFSIRCKQTCFYWIYKEHYSPVPEFSGLL